MKLMKSRTNRVVSILLIALSCSIAARSSNRTLETPFALSSDQRSEFATRFPVVSEGSILIEAQWTTNAIASTPVSLRLILIQPDGNEAGTRSGNSTLRLEHQADGQEIEKFSKAKNSKWTVKIINDADVNRSEVSGTLRITVPANERTLEDTQFTLLGSGNAQEIPFVVPAPGKVEVAVTWEVDVLARTAEVPLVVSLIHPGESRTFARRQGASPIHVEHQVTEVALDRGGRWLIRVQNDTQTKVAGRVRITFTPSI